MRDKTIITMAKELRLYIVGKINKEKEKAQPYHGSITPKAQSQLEVAKEESEKWTPCWVGDLEDKSLR